MIDDKIDRILFVVDTDTYAGNFERAMTAYVTGVVGECEVGEKEAAMFRAQWGMHAANFASLMMQVPDEHGCCRPTSIYPTPGYFNDGMGHEYPDSEWDSPRVVQAYRDSIREYQLQHPGSLADMNPETAKPRRAPAYHSVAMYMHSNIDDARADFMMERAIEFTNKFRSGTDFSATCGGPFKIIGFRVIHEYTKADVLRVLPAADKFYPDC